MEVHWIKLSGEISIALHTGLHCRGDDLRLNQALWLVKLMRESTWECMGLFTGQCSLCFSKFPSPSLFLLPHSPSVLLLSLLMSSILPPPSSCLPDSPLLSAALFGSVFGLWRPRGSHAVFSTQSAVSLLPGPDPAILSTHSLPPWLSPSFSHHPSLPRRSWPLSAVRGDCNVCQRHSADAREKKKKKEMHAGTSPLFCPPPSPSLPPSLPALPASASAVWVESAGRKKRGQKVRELQSVQKCFIAVMWRGWCGGWRGSNARAPVTWTDLDWQVTLLTCHCANTVYCTTTQTNMLNCNCPERPTQQTLVRICPEAMTV